MTEDAVSQIIHIPGFNPDETHSILLCHNKVTNPQTHYKLDLLMMTGLKSQSNTSQQQIISTFAGENFLETRSYEAFSDDVVVYIHGREP